ncbi:MAG: extracellular solute-binding protein [Clostridia bacterium]|nr:extracellular solute-binding protein [Clostridia bacterium]MBO4884285.1 extracellular solute-binding protein [Clostridia bacterium]
MKKLLCTLLALLLVAGACCTALADVTFPLSDEVITLTAFATAGPYTKGDFNDLAMWKVMEELTHIKFEFDAAPSGQGGERLGLLFAANTLPDVIFKTGISNNDVVRYAADGQLQPIGDLLEEHAPNFNALLVETPEIYKAIVQADGQIYGFPYIVTASPSNISPKLFYNYKFVEQNGFEPADTLDDLLEQMRAFKDSDWNGNGQADELPLASQSLGSIINAFAGTFGIMTRGKSSTYWDVDENGELRFIPTSEGYKEMLMFLNSIYEEGLLDQQIFTADLAYFQAAAAENRVLFGFDHNTTYMTTYSDDFIGLPAPLSKAEGDEKFWAGQGLSVGGGNTFITGNCQYPAEVVSYFDYFYSNEGLNLFFLGIEGETYELDEDGIARYTDFVTANPDGLSMEEALGTYICWSGGNNPSVADDVHFGDNLINESTTTAAKNLAAYGPEVIWPGSFTYTEEESEILSDLKLDIDRIVSEKKAAFVAGNESFDNWDAYVASIEAAGLDEFREIVQAGLDRYNAIGE